MKPIAAPPAGGALAAASQRLWSGYVTALKFIAGGSMLVVVVVMVAQVAARYLFGGSIIWAEELCRYILVWQTFLLIGLAYHQGELVALDLLGGRISRGALLALRLVVSLPVWGFLWLMVEHGWAHADRFKGQNIPAIDFIWQSLAGHPAGVPVFWVYVAVPVGCALLLAHLVGSYLHDLWAYATGRPDPHASLSHSPAADDEARP